MWNSEPIKPAARRINHLEPLQRSHYSGNQRTKMDNGDNNRFPTNLHTDHNRFEPETSETVTVAGNPRRPPSETKPKVMAGSNNQAQSDRFVTGGGFGRGSGAGGGGSRYRYFDFNFHAMKKSVSSGLLDVALLMANSSQLKHVYLAGKERNAFYEALIILLSLSIFFQVVIGCILIWLSRININEADDKRHRQAEVLNNIVVVGIFILTVLNVFASSLGISDDYGLNSDSKNEKTTTSN